MRDSDRLLCITMNVKMMLLLATVIGILAVDLEAKYHRDNTGLRHHRHQHDSRKNHEIAERRWDDLEYDDSGYTADKDDDSYEVDHYRNTYERNYRGRQKDYYNRFEARYSPRNHHHRNRWYQEDKRYRNSYLTSRRNHRNHPGRDRKYYHGYRNHDEYDDDFDGYDRARYDDDEYDTDVDESRDDYYTGRRSYDRNFRKHKFGYDSNDPKGRRKDWYHRMNSDDDDEADDSNGRRKSTGSRRGGKRTRVPDDDEKKGRELGDRRISVNSNDSTDTSDTDIWNYHNYNDNDAEDQDSDEALEEEDSIWKEAESEEDDDFDNDSSKSEAKAPLRTFDDIIKRLTSDDPTTPEPTMKREYRNIEIEKYLKRDAYGNLKYQSTTTVKSSEESSTTTRSPYLTASVSSTGKNASENKTRSPSVVLDHKATNVISAVDSEKTYLKKKSISKMEESQAKTKSLEQEYEDYENGADNEKEEDLMKVGVEEDIGMQADTNVDYSDDDNVEDDDETTPATTSTTSTTTTTTTTTTTPRPSVPRQRYERQGSRAYQAANGPQYNGYKAKSEYPPMSDHSKHKWQFLGTADSVRETRRNMQQYNANGKSAEIHQAIQHAIKVSKEASCQWPRARVIPVHDVYPNPSTTYSPHCAILHRCSDDTGCCRSEALTCVPKHSHRVELYFYTTNIGRENVVKKLSFYNHTECECREKSEYEGTNDKSSETSFWKQSTSAPPQNIRRPPQRKPCRCPSEFTPRITPEGECLCNCFKNDQNCISTRRGKSYFSLRDRLCVQNKECAPPVCEFGEYMSRQGKCPLKKDIFDAVANYHANLSPRHRS
ncbi:dentin sialophosphoprotein [Cephus cinctus]|uniref:Dentin sialophosphoprotein n=1 Tax=Cephus cinctus TaxID=211228 RepID=A0AAJ7BZW8_CEPCN|nr:dentin sialophosphoprotein [Cephus cinctus]